MSTHLNARAARGGEILEQCIASLLAKNEPADRFLAELFRGDRRMGSRDRRFVSNLVFAYFRWRGWVAKTDLPKNLVLPGVFACEGTLSDCASVWCAEAGIPFGAYEKIVAGGGTSRRRFEAFLTLGGKTGNAFADSDILPEWSVPMLEEGVIENILFLQKRPPVWIRSRAKDSSALAAALEKRGIVTEKFPSRSDTLKIPDAKGALTAVPEFLNGDFELQDLSSQCIGLASKASPGESWWDVCAGAGGKTLQLASMMENQGRIFATDVRTGPLLELKKRSARAGFSNLKYAVRDARENPSGGELFDGVLIDAPCSGSGRWRRNPDARWSASEQIVSRLASTQAAILESACRSVKPGGVLIYATCSLFELENRANVMRFLEKHPEFFLEAFAHPLFPDRTTDGMLAVLPVDADCDGAFAARMRRRLS